MGYALRIRLVTWMNARQADAVKRENPDSTAPGTLWAMLIEPIRVEHARIVAASGWCGTLAYLWSAWRKAGN